MKETSSSTFLSGNESETFLSWASVKILCRTRGRKEHIAKEARYMCKSILQHPRTRTEQL